METFLALLARAQLAFTFVAKGHCSDTTFQMPPFYHVSLPACQDDVCPHGSTFRRYAILLIPDSCWRHNAIHSATPTLFEAQNPWLGECVLCILGFLARLAD